MGNFEIDSEDFLAYWRVEMLYAMINLNSGLILKLKYLALILDGYKSFLMKNLTLHRIKLSRSIPNIFFFSKSDFWNFLNLDLIDIKR